MRNVSRQGAAPQDESANSCICNIYHLDPDNERPSFPDTFCGILYRTNYINLSILHIEHASPPLCFLQRLPCRLCYDGVAHAYSDRASGREGTAWTLSRWWIT